jgi:hypothetical protein
MEWWQQYPNEDPEESTLGAFLEVLARHAAKQQPPATPPQT